MLANSAGMERRARALGAERTRVVHLGSDVPAEATPAGTRRIVTVGSLIARKRHGDVLRALWLLREEHPALEWIVVGDGPERGAVERLAQELGLGDRVRFTGPLAHEEAVAQARRGVFVLPSVDEAFGVAYVEAMAGGVPAIGCRGEDGPEEIAAAGDGIRLVPPAEPEALAAELDDAAGARRLAPRARRRRPRDGGGLVHLGGAAGGRRSRRTSRRCAASARGTAACRARRGSTDRSRHRAAPRRPSSARRATAGCRPA